MRMEAPSLVNCINESRVLDLIKALGMFLQRLTVTSQEMNQRMTSLSITMKVPNLVKRFNESLKFVLRSPHQSPNPTLSHSGSYINKLLSLITMRMEAANVVNCINESCVLDLINAPSMFLQRLMVASHDMNQCMTNLLITTWLLIDTITNNKPL